MADTKTEIPEFARFLRRMGVQALDNFANRLAEKDVTDENSPKPVRKIAEHWRSMSAEQKDEFVGKVLTTAEAVAAAAPAAIVALKARSAEAKSKKAAAKSEKPSEEKPKKKASKKKSEGEEKKSEKKSDKKKKK